MIGISSKIGDVVAVLSEAVLSEAGLNDLIGPLHICDPLCHWNLSREHGEIFPHSYTRIDSLACTIFKLPLANFCSYVQYMCIHLSTPTIS